MTARARICWLLAVLTVAGSFGSVEQLRAQQRQLEHPLFRAVRTGDLRLARSLLDQGTPADVADDQGTTPLMVAALHGHPEMMDELLKRGADPNCSNEHGVTPLVLAASSASKTRLLLDHGAEVNVASRLGNTPLGIACRSPRGATTVALLLERGADITARNKVGHNVLRRAAASGNIDTVRTLIQFAEKQGATKDLIDGSGRALATAGANGFDEIVDLLLEHGADPNHSDASRGGALHDALLAGQSGIAAQLVERGAELDGFSEPGHTPTAVLAVYSEVDDPSLLTLLHRHGVDFRDRRDDSQTAFTWARLRGHKKMSEVLAGWDIPEGTLPPRVTSPDNAIGDAKSDRIRQAVHAVQSSIDLLQQSSDTFLNRRRNCVSCHHQNLPGVAIGRARYHGFHTSEESTARMIQRQVSQWTARVERAYQLDSPFPVPPRFLGWGMWSFGELGYAPDELTDAVTWYLRAIQQPNGRWTAGMLRPPMGGSDIMATALAVRALQLFPDGARQENQRRIELAKGYLRRTQPTTLLDCASRLLGLSWAGADPETLASDARRLWDSQRSDGGWSQLPGLESDAWATGQMLVTLRLASPDSIGEASYWRGVDFLLRTQFEDGSWYVQSRTWPFQPYFESDFPYGRDQWISAPATAWASMALMQTLDRQDVEHWNEPHRSAADRPSTTSQRAAAPRRKLPPAASEKIDFAADIEPLLERSCRGCHGQEDPQANFSMTSRAALLRGGDSELPAVIPGVSDQSPLVRLAAGLDPEIQMPPDDAVDEFPRLSDTEIAKLRAWIDQGADW